MLELSLEQRLELARLVYPPTDIDDWCIYEGAAVQAYKTDEYGWVVCTAATEFSPSITGEDRQKLQALDVIVAAFDLPFFQDFHRIKGGAFRFGFEQDEEREVYDGPDLLHASALALLGDKT